jgi:aspartate ammonia-lyase
MFAVVQAAAEAGELELNVMEPVITRHLLDGLSELGQVAVLFAQRCVDGLRWDVERVAAHLAGSRAAAVEEAARIGYARVADAAR